DVPGDILRATGAPAGGAERLRLTSTRPWLRYQANGTAAHSNLSVNACARGLLRGKVVVNRLGRVRSERPRQEIPRPCAGSLLPSLHRPEQALECASPAG